MDQMNSVCTVYHEEVCTIGLELNEECHKKLYCRCSGNILASDLEAKQKSLIEWRTGITFDDDSKICDHHEKKYFSRYESLQKCCSDPMKIHKLQVKSKWVTLK